MLGCATGYTQEKVTCKATISFHGQELSGRMMFKKVAEDTVRFAFFNELGMSFVEGSLAVRSSQFAVRSRRPALKAEPEGSAVNSQHIVHRPSVYVSMCICTMGNGALYMGN